MRRCLEGGTQEVARALSQEEGTEYAPGEWRASSAGARGVVVMRELKPRDGSVAASFPPRHSAVWLVKESGDQLVIKPSSSDARRITLASNRCEGRP
jgi:hypothetical protein